MLNDAQNKAIKYIKTPLLVLAGAGSGKTKVIIHKIAHLIKIGIPSYKILGVTFTNRAANEMQERALKLSYAKVYISTFHSLGARILRESIEPLGYTKDFSIFDEEDSLKLLKECLKKLNYKDKNIKTIKKKISKEKNNALSQTEKGTFFMQIFNLYQSNLKKCNAVDFDDLLFLTVKLLEEHESILEKYQQKWSYVLVDEYQDTNFFQNLLLKLICKKHQNICVVGDPDQSIYSFRGARYKNILDFEKNFKNAKIIKLEKNYRSTKTILNVANHLIANNKNRYEKDLFTDLEVGEKIKLFIAEDEKKEAYFVVKTIKKLNLPLSKTAVFYRTNFQSRAFEDFFIKNNIPYVIYGSISFYKRKEIKDILAYLKMVTSNDDFIAFSRTINLPLRGIGKKSVEKLINLSSEKNIPIFSLCQKALKKNIFTAKQKKGIEEYISLILEIRKSINTKKIHEIIEEIILKTNYLSYLKEDENTFDDRKENLQEFIVKAKEFENKTLLSFLQEIALLTNTETKNYNAVKLMTIHNSKGLEFTNVFITGLEEELFPHINAMGNLTKIEEERRLFYVAITRAKKRVFLSHCNFRYFKGKFLDKRPSRFLKEIPNNFLEKHI